MSISLDYWVSISKAGKFHLAFYTTQISSSPAAARDDPVKNEVEFGLLYSAVSAHQLVSVVLPPGSPHAVHQFMETPKNQADLDLSIQFSRHLEHQELVVDDWFRAQTHWQRWQCSQTVAKMELHQAELLSFQATENETFTANFRVTGGSGMSYSAESECEKWVKA